ncbi:MAG: chromosome segregation protein SMC [Synergistaceae bacterium]|nr:chromosome segregation protein SMC [Synergistaceae bacterium]
MYIARLQLRDFKSFGGSHDLPLTPGMTAIVGPNGSGKSNILDSLRWVLGDSHGSKLRVSKQDGLIFHGSVSRGQGTEASVSIQMRDGIRVCTIRRRVSDAGATVTVDGVRVTLAELDEVKRTWNMGGDKFAFIGQGDVAEVIQQRPQARRVLLESLFGIDSYRRRREEASGRLGEARDEYGRLRTFSAELLARREEIAPEVGRAELARGLLDSLEEKRRLLYWARRANNEVLSRQNEERQRYLSSLLSVKEAWFAGWERSIVSLERDVSALSKTRQLQVRELDDARSALAGFTRTAYGYGASLASALRRAQELTADRSGLDERLSSLRTEREQCDLADKTRVDELDALKKSLAEAEKRRRSFEERTRDARERNERLNRERGEIEGEMSALKARMKSIGLSLRALGEGGEPSPRDDDPLKAVKKELEDIELRHASLLEEQERASTRHRDLYARLQVTSGDLQRNRRELSKLTNRLSELQEQAASEVYPRPVQHVLSAVKLGRLRANVRAAIDSFKCPPELAAALEAFLGGRQFWILTDTMEEVSVCIDTLKKNQAGRATFFPLERSRPRQRDNSRRLPEEGIVGWAMDLLEIEEHWRPAIEHIMGDLLIVESYPVGQSLVRGGFRGPVATLDGDVFQPGGSISGGRAQKQGRAMEVVSAVSRVESEVSAMRSLVDSLSKDFSRLEAEEAEAAAEHDAASAGIRELSARRSSCDQRREEILRERARMKNERESMLAALKECGISFADLMERKSALEGEPAGAEELASDEGMSVEIERLKNMAALAEEKRRSGFVLSERIITELRSTEAAVSNLEAEISSCGREVLTNRANLAALAKRYAEVASRRRAVTDEMTEFKDRYEVIESRRAARTARLDAARMAVQNVSSELSSAGLRSAELSRERLELVQTWEEQYPYPGPGAVSDADAEELRRAIREYDRNLKALGDVDMGVLSEDRNLRDRLAYLGDQLDDVGRSIRELERLISDADEQARAMFANALEEIDKKFSSLFQRLFGGGEAHLEMVEGASLWDSGVDVVARPPGKHPTGIAQLSGGEQSLSAIALLFASLEAASCPIAVLDEVDAALDEVNLRRFADLARDASKERQIFVMTHRRLTMERADVLYGVTLAEPGLSQVIGVRVEDWA